MELFYVDSSVGDNGYIIEDYLSSVQPMEVYGIRAKITGSTFLC